MSEDAHDSGYPLTIKGECAQCHLVYVLDEHNNQCPQCTEVSLVWATNVTQVYNAKVHPLPTAEYIRKRLGYTRTEEEIRDIEWLEKLFQLEDTRGL